MSDTVWWLSVAQWIALQAVGALLSATAVVVTGLFLARQLRLTARAAVLEGIREMKGVVTSFREDRTRAYAELPIALVLGLDQFAKRPPGPRRQAQTSEEESKAMRPRPEQAQALVALSDEHRLTARHVINGLNDLWLLVETGCVPRDIVLGMHHEMIIPMCHLVELVRRDLDKDGDYGQRILRARHAALVYRQRSPKHRKKALAIRAGGERRIIVHKEGCPAARHDTGDNCTCPAS